MAVTTDIAASYRRPGAIIRAHLARGESEPRALAFLMGACIVLFVAQWPAMARDAYLSGTELNPLLAGALLSTVFILPLVFYALAGLSQLAARAVRRPIGGFAARIALFWALLASSPIALLNGLVDGFIGDGVELQIVGALWLAVFLWFWISGLRAARAEADV